MSAEIFVTFVAFAAGGGFFSGLAIGFVLGYVGRKHDRSD